MADVIVNNSAAAIGLWDTSSVNHVVGAMGGTGALEPDMVSRDVVDVLVASGELSVAEAVAPVNTSAPTIAGDAVVGSTLTCDDGEWSGVPAPAITRQWKADDVAIVGATGGTYELTAGDEGKEITVTVTATNVEGSDSETSAAVGPVTAE